MNIDLYIRIMKSHQIIEFIQKYWYLPTRLPVVREAHGWENTIFHWDNQHNEKIQKWVSILYKLIHVYFPGKHFLQ